MARQPELMRKLLASLTDQQCRNLKYHWPFWARPSQLLPSGEDWLIWAIIAGRGFGKTRCGAETVRWWAETFPGIRIALVGRTTADVRDVMIKGESGILAISHPGFRPRYQPSLRLLTWPNGSTAHAYSADEPSLLRGPQHHKAWVDELAAWKYLEAFEQLEFGLRLGNSPQMVVTTTPRPIKLLKDILARAKTRTTRGSTFENRANLADSFVQAIITTYLGTRMGEQEIFAQIRETIDGALWNEALLALQRWAGAPFGTRGFPRLARTVVGVDPAITHGPDADGTGIVAAGKTWDGRGVVLRDASGDYSPAEWADVVLEVYDAVDADAIVVERNRGGDLVKNNIIQACQGGWIGRNGRRLPRRQVPRIIEVHASGGKDTRAEPYVAMYERGRIWHVGEFPTLEEQMCSYIPGESRVSPNGMDALVHALAELFPPIVAMRAHRDKPSGF